MAARSESIVLEPDKIVATIGLLRQRIAESFPGSGLSNVAATLHSVAGAAVEKAQRIRRPRPILRTISGLLLAAMVAFFAFAASHARAPAGTIDALDLVQTIEATLSGLVLIGAIVLFVVTLEVRSKRKETLEALHELRVLAHVIDLHQLAKDPERSFDEPPGLDAGVPESTGGAFEGAAGREAPSDPVERLSPFDLDHYLNYCGDMLALVGKVAAWYLQGFQDEVVLGAVNEIEDLTNGLSRKIWQKLMLLDQIRTRR